MPVVVRAESADRWLAGEDDALGYALEHAPDLKARAVDRRVNNARNEGADLIEEAG
jgi:putative SOS response-associated peptidase YedK